MRAFLAGVCVLAACGKGDDKPRATAADPAPAAGAFAKLRVTFEGKPVAIDRAFIKRISPDAYVLQLGAGQGSCEALMSGAVDAQPGATSFAMTIFKRVAPTGHEKHVIADFWSRDWPVKPVLGGAVTLAGEPARGAQVAIELPRILDVPPPRTDARLVIEGALTAVGCGDQPVTGLGAPKTPKKSKATITIAGKQLPIRGVVFNTPDIVISTSPKDCSQVTPSAPVILERVRGHWGLRGTWFEQPVQNTALPDPATEQLQFGARGVTKTDEGPVLDMVLSGTGKIGDYDVKLEGTIEALECVR